MKIKYNHEIISGTVFALISSFLWFSIPTQVKTMEKTAITAQTLPKIAIGGYVCFCRLPFAGRHLYEGKRGIDRHEGILSFRCL